MAGTWWREHIRRGRRPTVRGIPPEAEQPERTWVPSKLDVGIALAAVVVVCVGSVRAGFAQPHAQPLDAFAFTLLVAAALALAWRRRTPLATLGVIVLLVSGYLLSGYPYGPIQLCMVLAMFEVARLRPMRTSLTACALAIVVSAIALQFRSSLSANIPSLFLAFWASWLVIPWSVGALVQVRAAANRRLREELVASAALRERIRLGREVHDVAGHGFSAVAMQAGVALLVFDEQPEQARKSVEAIQSTSAKALADLRTMLDAFHRDPESPSEGLHDLEDLVEHVRTAGLRVRMSVDDVPASGEVDRTGYEVVREALTNVLRHAGPTTADVRVHREGRALVVEVADDGVGAGEVTFGRGLTGMRERVTAVGGSLEAGTRPGGGFRVLARLPITGGAG